MTAQFDAMFVSKLENSLGHSNPRQPRKMILSPCDIELTKIHYYSEKNAGFSGREHRQNAFNKNVIIKKNVFGRRWVLKINEDERRESKDRRAKVVVYVLVFCSIIVAVGFGIFLSLDKHIFQNSEKFEKGNISNNVKNITNYTAENSNLRLQDTTEFMSKNGMNKTTIEETTPNAKNAFCAACDRDHEVCLKRRETEKPECVRARDPDDPTGCGGLCQISTHYCRILDRNARVYQCWLLKGTLECSNGTFSCGNRCIPAESRCDGAVDCSDGSDERHCDCDLKTHFQCGNSTSCLEFSKKCDRNFDCWDKSDEANCIIDLKCSQNEFPCFNNHCIPKENFCDGSYDCADKSDEPVGCQVTHLK